MEDTFYPVQHHMMIMSYEKTFGIGQRKETWIWDVYVTKLDKVTFIRCECTSDGKNAKIPWFEVKDIDASQAIKDACKYKMQQIIA